MKLINRYVNEVGKNLPLIKGREDIEKELRSTLEDMLEERSQKAGKSADEAMEIELLKEYGAPFDVAMSYNPQPYLIGPRMFPSFLAVIKIVIPIVLIVLFAVTGIRAATETSLAGSEFTEVIFDGIGNAISGTIMALGNIVVVFAVLERLYPDATIEELEEGKIWEPESLVKEPEPDSVKRGDLIAEIIFTLIGLAFLNGIFSTPVFGEGFAKFIPWINSVFLVEIVLDVFLLRQAMWTIPTRIVKIVIEGASVVIATILLRTPDAIGFTAEAFKYVPESSSVDLEMLMGIFNIGISIALVVVIVISSIEVIKAGIGVVKSLNRK
ncbi:MAG: hypothetical protein HC797_05985 [Anaerolineales bacterium]|nr:hypothetical protein [Anaerolineales bacterium]